MSFHEIRFPSNLSFGASGGPERRTDVVTLANGYEERNTPWKHSRRFYDAGLAMRSLDDLETVVAFFEARQGQLHGFRWKDWADFKSCRPSEEPASTDQVIGAGNGSETGFNLSKTYTSGMQNYIRPVTKPVAGSVRIAVAGIEIAEGTGFSVDLTTGLVTMVTPPPAGQSITAGFEFDVPVRFDTDRIQVSVATFEAGQLPDVPVVEVRV